MASAKRTHDQALLDYSRITATFQAVVTQRYANLGTLLQSGVASSVQAMPLVQLSEDDLFRLVIPVPEHYVPYIRLGNPVEVRVPSLGRSFPGRLARFSKEVKEDTRTMHTEVDVPNPHRELLPGLYAEATLTLDKRERVLAIPQQAINIGEEQSTAWVVDASDRLELRRVKLGIETPDDVEVVSGLHEGELVVVGDRSTLRAGEPVRPKQIELINSASGED